MKASDIIAAPRTRAAVTCAIQSDGMECRSHAEDQGHVSAKLPKEKSRPKSQCFHADVLQIVSCGARLGALASATSWHPWRGNAHEKVRREEELAFVFYFSCFYLFLPLRLMKSDIFHVPFQPLRDENVTVHMV